MTLPSHNLVMASADAITLIEVLGGYGAARQASGLLEKLFETQLAELNETADRRTRNELKWCLLMLIRRDARLGGLNSVLSALA